MSVFFSFFKPRANFLRFCFAVSHQHFTQKFTRHIIIITHTGITLIITVASENHGRSVTTHTRLTLTQSHAIRLPIRGGEREGRKEEGRLRRLATDLELFFFLSLSRHPGLVTKRPSALRFPICVISLPNAPLPSLQKQKTTNRGKNKKTKGIQTNKREPQKPPCPKA